MDAKGQVRLIVNYIVCHEDSNREATSTAQETRTDLSARKYRILWHGIRSNKDTWEPRSSLLCKVIDVVWSYESVESVYLNLLANVNVLLANESDKVVHDVKN